MVRLPLPLNLSTIARPDGLLLLAQGPKKLCRNNDWSFLVTKPGRPHSFAIFE